MSESINLEQFEMHLATEHEIDILPAIETAADSLFSQVGFNDLPAAASAAELKNAKAIIVTGRPPVGFARIEELGGNAHLEQLSVTPELAGNGIGGKLLEETCVWAARQGYSAITLVTFQFIPWNAPFYEKHGFKMVNELTAELESLRQHEVELGLDNFGPRLVMKKPLQSTLPTQ